jgi:hypothetical protein
MYDAVCQRIREFAEAHKVAVPESLRPTAVPGPKAMYHVNLSGARCLACCGQHSVCTTVSAPELHGWRARPQAH